jgi:hypothetical protein
MQDYSRKSNETSFQIRPMNLLASDMSRGAPLREEFAGA